MFQEALRLPGQNTARSPPHPQPDQLLCQLAGGRPRASGESCRLRGQKWGGRAPGRPRAVVGRWAGCMYRCGRHQAGRVEGQSSLGGVGHLPHDDVAALGLGQHRLHLADIPHALLRLVVLAVAWGEHSCVKRPPARTPRPRPTARTHQCGSRCSPPRRSAPAHSSASGPRHLRRERRARGPRMGCRARCRSGWPARSLPTAQGLSGASGAPRGLLPGPCYSPGVGWGGGCWELTWHRDEELDGIPVAMEAELCLRHGAVGDEAAGCPVAAVVAIHMDDAAGAGPLSRRGGGLVG